MLSKSSIENQVRYILIIFSVLLFSFTMISCGGSDDDVTVSTNGLFVTVGNNGIILTSSDGTAWDNRISGTTYNLVGITYVNSTFVTVGDNGTAVSVDLTNQINSYGEEFSIALKASDPSDKVYFYSKEKGITGREIVPNTIVWPYLSFQ